MCDLTIPARLRCVTALLMFVLAACATSLTAEAPRFIEKNGRWALLVDGQPYLMLGGQIHNSSSLACGSRLHPQSTRLLRTSMATIMALFATFWQPITAPIIHCWFPRSPSLTALQSTTSWPWAKVR
jgi:hypothetical protein